MKSRREPFGGPPRITARGGNQMDDMRRCPYCDEEIRAEAIRCRHCRSRLAALDPSALVPGPARPPRRAASRARSPTPLRFRSRPARSASSCSTVFHLVGAVAYGALWLLVPFRPGESRRSRASCTCRDGSSTSSATRFVPAAAAAAARIVARRPAARATFPRPASVLERPLGRRWRPTRSSSRRSPPATSAALAALYRRYERPLHAFLAPLHRRTRRR